MRVVLNIGLLAEQGEHAASDYNSVYWQDKRAQVAVAECLRVLTGPALVEIRRDFPEPTLVVEGQFLLRQDQNALGLLTCSVLHAWVHRLAEVCHQEAVAYTFEVFDLVTRRYKTMGRLAGPQAAKWAPFDNSRFLTHQGAFK